MSEGKDSFERVFVWMSKDLEVYVDDHQDCRGALSGSLGR